MVNATLFRVLLLMISSVSVVCTFQACESVEAKQPMITFTDDAVVIRELNYALTEALLQDGFSPTGCSRAFAYSNVAAYEALLPADSSRLSLAGQLNGLDSLPKPLDGIPVNTSISMVVAFTKVANSIIYRDYIITSAADSLIAKLKKGVPTEIVNNSLAWGDSLGTAVMLWSRKDNFKETRNMPRYEVRVNDPSAWVPTPPKFVPALEPHWDKLRSFSMDSSGQFSPGLTVPFSIEKGSEFYNMAMEVYDSVNLLSEQYLPSALFWDCNPMVSENYGHFMGMRRQYSPGSHWINITRMACESDSADLCRSTEAYMLVSLALADAFISCWHTKYTTNLIRPETYINRHIDPNWKPALETPMFPEHTSGHSVISMASAVVLTKLFGEPFIYSDSTNVPYNRPTRHFNSFMEAANEAAISRLYGGIHFRPAIELGQVQGADVANNLLNRVKTRKEELVQ